MPHKKQKRVTNSTWLGSLFFFEKIWDNVMYHGEKRWQGCNLVSTHTHFHYQLHQQTSCSCNFQLAFLWFNLLSMMSAVIVHTSMHRVIAFSFFFSSDQEKTDISAEQNHLQVQRRRYEKTNFLWGSLCILYTFLLKKDEKKGLHGYI